ncbi:helix-turn-helix domain-containing protein [Paenibacillaceae bacterium]|nr:helix-turn-helix domain-containing protein [Paenibacillaceae bacterium]
MPMDLGNNDAISLKTERSIASVVYTIADVQEITAVPGQPVELELASDTSALLIVTAGDGEYRMADTAHPLQSGTVATFATSFSASFQYTLPCPTIMQLHCRPQSELRAILISYEVLHTLKQASARHGRLYSSRNIEATSAPTAMEVVEADESIIALARELAILKDHNGLGGPLAANRLLYELLFQVRERLRLHKQQLESKLTPIDQTIAYINEHYNRKITREQLAHLSGLSIKSFTALFKQSTGSSFSEYVNAVRIRKAQEQLLLTGSKLSDIAQKVGYKDEFYLSRKFKQTVGVAPSVYVKQPKTIASMDHAYTLDLLTLGMTPAVAIADSWIVKRFDGLLKAGSCHAIDWSWQRQARYQLLQSLAPDVIINAELKGEDLEAFSKIAPVLQIPWKGVGWRDHFRMVADVVEMTGQADDWLSRFDERMEGAKRQLDRNIGPKATIAIFNIRATRLAIYGSGYMGADLLYKSLGMNPPLMMRTAGIAGKEWIEVTPEQLRQIEADYMIVAVENTSEGWKSAREVMRHRDWKKLTSVRNKQTYFVDMAKWYGYGPAAIEAQLEELIGWLGEETGLKIQTNHAFFNMDSKSGDC